jgi:ATP-dependent Clp protease ATP-binding subunit ClpA
MAQLTQDALDSAIIKNVIDMSFNVAVNLEQTTITTEHVLFVMLQSRVLKTYFTSKGIDVSAILTEVVKQLTKSTPFLQNLIPSDDSEKFIGQLTAELTKFIGDICSFAKSEKREVDAVDILLGLINLKDTYASYFMRKNGITEDIILELRKGMSANMANYGQLNKENNALATYCVNLNEKAKTNPSDPLIGRDREIFTIAHTLVKRKKCNALLIGDPGVGKSMIVEGLAARINAGNVPVTLKGKEIYSLDMGTLLAGCKFRGDLEDKIREILDDLSSKPNSILFIDEAHQIDAGDKGQMGVGLSTMLKPELSRGKIKVIASTTWEGYRQTFEKDTALLRRFRTVTIDEPSDAETLAILKGNRSVVEEFHGVTIEDSALEAAIELTVKYQSDKKLPDKAIDILDSACARKRVVENETLIINRASIVREITDVTGITIKSETNNEDAAERILKLHDRLKKVIFHQEKAIDTVSRSLVISQAGLKKPSKPIGSFLLVGPSGVGKTFLAQQLAVDLNMHFIRFNMSEFMEKHSVSRLIGAPPGYVGFGNGGSGEGELINALLKNPNSVVLFDEVEKAHPDVFNVFLQLLDDGEISGTTGKTASAKNCMIVMTSNLGTREGSKIQTGFNSNKTGKSASSKAIDEFFLTELRGRITAIVEFNDLDDLSYRKIVTEAVNNIAKLISSKNLKIIPSEELITHVLELNNSSEYGARGISKFVTDLIDYPLSVKLLTGQISSNSIVNLDWKDNDLVIDQSFSTIAVEIPTV